MILIFTVLVSIILMNLLVGLAVSDIQVFIIYKLNPIFAERENRIIAVYIISFDLIISLILP